MRRWRRGRKIHPAAHFLRVAEKRRRWLRICAGSMGRRQVFRTGRRASIQQAALTRADQPVVLRISGYDGNTKVRTVFPDGAFSFAAFLNVTIPNSPASCLSQETAPRRQEKSEAFGMFERWQDDAERVPSEVRRGQGRRGISEKGGLISPGAAPGRNPICTMDAGRVLSAFSAQLPNMVAKALDL